MADALKAIPNPLVSEAITVTSLAGITGSASGAISIALAAMASGGMDTPPHSGAAITPLGVTGPTHRASYKGIFAVSAIKTTAAFVIIVAYNMFDIV